MTTALAPDYTRPSAGVHEFYSRATVAFNSAATLALLIAAGSGLVPIDSAAGRTIADHIKTAEEYVSRMQELLKRQERTIEEQRVEAINLSRLNAKLSADMATMIREDLETQREITQLRTSKAEGLARLEAIGMQLHELIGATAEVSNEAHKLIRDQVGFIRPLGATPVTSDAPIAHAARGA